MGLGVPADSILVIPGAANSTRMEAEIVREYLQSQAGADTFLAGVDTLLLVSSPFHTRRAYWIFDRTFSGSAIEIRMSAAPEPRFDATNWWQSERGFLTFFNEYLKLAYYFSSY